MARSVQSTPPPPIVVLYGDEEFAKGERLRETLDRVLPPPIDRGMALCEYDGEKSEEQGGPSLAAVMDDLRTLPFLAERRAVIVRQADKFVSAWREKLEGYLSSPSPTGVLILTCRSFPKTTRLYKSASAAGGEIIECRKLSVRELAPFVIDNARQRGKRLSLGAAERLADLIGADQGLLAGEVEKLALYVGDRAEITEQDVADLVGLTREERVFAAVDAAGAGRLRDALTLWEEVLATDPEAVFKALGGVLFVVRRWLTAHELLDSGESIRAIAPKVMMWGRERDLEAILRRIPRDACRRLLAQVADLDAQAKLGLRSIDTGVALVLARLAASAA